MAVDLANTWYDAGSEVIDFLAEAAGARRWTARVTCGDRVDDVRLLRQLRDAVRTLIVARTEGRPLDAAAVRIVNRHAAAACASVAMVAGARGEVTARVLFRGDGRARAKLATSCVEVLTGTDPVRRCEGPGCPLFFVQDHGRRRFCHAGCSHRARMQRYRGREH